LKNLKIVLFADCIPVKGINRSVICDTRKNNYYIIPNGLFEILTKYINHSITEIKEVFNNNFNNIIDEYFSYLTENKIIFFTSNPENFPKIELLWDTPSKITNSILDLNNKNYDIYNVMDQLNILKCSSIQFRFFNKINYNYLADLLDYIEQNQMRFTSIDFIIPFNPSIKKKCFTKLIESNPRINLVCIYNSSFEESQIIQINRKGILAYTKSVVFDERNCGSFKSDYFTANLKLISESQKHNTCLNRKLSIDADGNIKNCPSMPQSFGNIKDTTLETALNHPDFKKYWNVNKDMIEVCKDCEFRHICTDCRAYTERTHFDGEIDLSKPLKCGYNPYTNEWAEWSTNPLKEKAIEYYGMQDLVKKDA